MTHVKLSTLSTLTTQTTLAVERPRPLEHEEWPPNYKDIYAWRRKTLQSLLDNPKLILSAKTYYANHPAEFIMDWMDTYDPRIKPPNSKWIPFVFFAKQADVIKYFHQLVEDQEGGLVEKCRDFGLSWLACAYSVWAFLFVKDFAIGWGSRKEDLVDKVGDPDSLFEKMRLLLERLPRIWLPKDFKWSKNSTFMKLTNPNNGAIIAGEAGDNIGRGGRRSLYFVDEAGHIERAEKVEAALGDNTNVRVDISSVNGLGNVFHRRRENGVLWQPDQRDYPKGYVRVFIADWRDHPAKNQEWYDTRKARYDREGMSHIFAQEVDRNYAAAVSNVVIPYEWIDKAVDAHLHIPYFDNNDTFYSAGLDVADAGGDRNALTIVKGVIWEHVEEWGSRDVGATARKAVHTCLPYRGDIKLQYDCVGVGAGVKSEYNRLIEENTINYGDIPFIPWNAGGKVINKFDNIIPDDIKSLQNGEFFGNLKAQAWWSLRTRFYKTFKARTEGDVYKTEELISLSSKMPLLEQLKKELAQPTTKQNTRLQMLIEKQPDGMKSPNLADSGVMAFFPLQGDTEILTGTYGM